MLKLLILEYVISFTVTCVHILAIILHIDEKTMQELRTKYTCLSDYAILRKRQSPRRVLSMFVIRSVALTLELLPNLLRFCTEIYLAIIYLFFL